MERRFFSIHTFFFLFLGTLISLHAVEAPPIEIPTSGEKLHFTQNCPLQSLEILTLFEQTAFQKEIKNYIEQDFSHELQNKEKKSLWTGTFLEYTLSLKETNIKKNIPFVLTRFSSLKGLPYYSISHQKYRVLFEEIYRIGQDSVYSDIKKIPPLPDFTLKELSSLKNPIRFYQKDCSLGASIWQSYLHQKGEKEAMLYYTNETTLKKWGTSLIAPHKMKMFFVITIEKEELHLKTAVIAKIDSVHFLRSRIEKSLANRLNATAWYFCTSLFEKPFVPSIVKPN